MTPEVTLIVVSKDDPSGLSRTLASVAIQDGPGLEAQVVVVTKGTSDDFAVPESLRPRTVHLRQPGKGISNAFNLGLQKARGEWICFLNGGDSFAGPDVLRAMAPHLEGPSLLVAARARDRATGVVIPRDRTFRDRQVELVSHQATFFRRGLFGAHGGYSEDYRIRMDLEWMLRLPPDVPATWVDLHTVDFEGGGLSSAHPVRSALEEWRALRTHGAPPSRLLLLAAVYLPFRVARLAWRRTRGA